MTQCHIEQHGIFHITTNAKGRVPWCVLPGVPEIMIDNLCMTRNVHAAKVHAFCVLPEHMHIILRPGEVGLSRFMHSFKRNSSRDIRAYLGRRGGNEPPLRGAGIGNVAMMITAAEDRFLRCGDGRTFTGWQHGFHDERIRDDDQRSNAMAYVQHNAYRHGLVQTLDGWPWSSLRFPLLVDVCEW
jgi:REP element-mobilizing transposase RayT